MENPRDMGMPNGKDHFIENAAHGLSGRRALTSIELFAGAGGLALGVSRAGFQHITVIERDADSCETIRYNQRRRVRYIRDWPLHQGDARLFNYSSIPTPVDLISGGPPCQPFSLGGKHLGREDHRDLFPEAIRAIRELKPKAFLLENVKGLLRQTFAKYFEYVLLQLNYPELTHKKGEDWTRHLGRLERHHTKGANVGLGYRIVFRLLNAADYGVPQKRERVFIVGFRDDLGVEWSFPQASHSLEALLWSQWKTGEYWDRHKIAKARRPARPSNLGAKFGLFPPSIQPWLTTRDAIADLPFPGGKSASVVLNHQSVPGARVYPGHTGSPFDEPAKTLKAGDHGVPGGENMLAHTDGKVRYFTVRESARLQCFPDDYGFRASWTESMRQVGNAVPVSLAEAVASHIRTHLEPAEQR